jgi:ParB family chromosome partitioning protein
MKTGGGEPGKRDRLGRGLGALLGEYLGEDAPESGSRLVPVGAIVPNPFQPRRDFSEQELADLVASIRENGLLQPIVVRPVQANGGAVQYELVAGERRWRAATRLGWREIPATVRTVDDRTLLVLALVENLQRSELSAFEEAEGYRKLTEDFSLSQQEIADVVGKDRSTVANIMRLLQLPLSIRQLVAAGKLSAGHARALLGVQNEHRMKELALRAADENWSVREIEEQVQKVRPQGQKRPARAARPRDANERRLEEELQRVLGTSVRIRGQGQRGRIEIPYYTVEDFERIYELLAGSSASDVVS